MPSRQFVILINPALSILPTMESLLPSVSTSKNQTGLSLGMEDM
jgi:hypothetical protein